LSSENKDKTKDELADVTGDEPSLLTDDDSEGKADQDNEKSDEMFIINGQQAAKQDMFVEDESPTTEVIDGVPVGDEPVEDPAPNGETSSFTFPPVISYMYMHMYLILCTYQC